MKRKIIMPLILIGIMASAATFTVVSFFFPDIFKTFAGKIVKMIFLTENTLMILVVIDNLKKVKIDE